MEKKPLEPHEARSYLMLIVSYCMLMMAAFTWFVLKDDGVWLGSIVFSMGLGLLLVSLGQRNSKQKPDLAKSMILGGKIVFGIALLLVLGFIGNNWNLSF